MEVFTDLTIKDIESLNFDRNERIQLQYTYVPDQILCEYLNKLSEVSNIRFRFYSYEGAFKCLSFLKYITNIKDIVLHDYEISNIDSLNELKNLNSLTIGLTRAKCLDFKKLKNLNKLSVIEVVGHSDVFELFKENINLTELYLENIKIGDLGRFASLNFLQRLDLTRCKCENYISLSLLGSLRYLSLANQDISSLDFIVNCKHIESLRLESLKVCELPNFQKCEKLKIISLIKMAKIRDFSILSTAPILNEIYITGIETVKLEDLYFLGDKKSVKKIFIDVKNKVNAKLIHEFLLSRDMK